MSENLRCVFCGGGLWIDPDTHVIECDEFTTCGAEWESNGDLRHLPFRFRG